MKIFTALASVLLLGASTFGQDVVIQQCEAFTNYDWNNDGSPEIVMLAPFMQSGVTKKHVLVLVEDRLLHAMMGMESVRPSVDRLVNDLAREGYRASAIGVTLGKSQLHQDGAYILALREFLRSIDNDENINLAGVILVGHFPDAIIVRTCNWRKKGDITLHKKSENEATYKDTRFLRRVPEDVARRADIVLSDLDGNWEDIYVQPKTKLETVVAVFPDGTVPANGGLCKDIERGSVTYEDFFHVSDGKIEFSEQYDAEGNPAGTAVHLFDTTGDHEVARIDRLLPNVIAHPDIMVSRIDTYGIALRPKQSIVGIDGNHLLDSQGKPQAVKFASKDDVPNWNSKIWERDEVLERKLLIEYFDRNHAYRTGQSTIAWRPSSLACDLGSGYKIMQQAGSEWVDADKPNADVHKDPTLANFMDWSASPAVLRTIRAHSNEYGSVFKKTKIANIDERLNGTPWSWTQKGDTLVPSLEAACKGGFLDWFLLRSMYENNAFAPEPAFYHHTGCNGISPTNGTKKPYDDPSYNLRQGGEALLFFGNGLALVGRAKVFYDEPQGFAETLRDGGTFGAAWAAYFDIESHAATWGKAGGDIGRKRSYFWSVLGDWTLRLSTASPSALSVR